MSSTDYGWVEDALGPAACVTVVTNSSVATVLAAFGADATTVLSGNDRYPFLGPFTAVISAVSVPGGVIAYEPMGFHGSLAPILSGLSAHERVSSLYWNEDAAMPRFTWAQGGVVSTSELFDFGLREDDFLPDEVAALEVELRAVDSMADGSERQLLTIGFAMLEQYSGIVVPSIDLFGNSGPPMHPIRI